MSSLYCLFIVPFSLLAPSKQPLLFPDVWLQQPALGSVEFLAVPRVPAVALHCELFSLYIKRRNKTSVVNILRLMLAISFRNVHLLQGF